MSTITAPQIAKLARIVVTGQITGKHSYYDLMLALRKLDARLPTGIPLMLHLEDVLAVQQTSGEYELNKQLRSIKSRRELYVHVVDCCAGTGPLAALLCGTKRTANVPALIGGFGDVQVVRDTSEKATTEGRKVLVIRAGAYKGVGTDGEHVSLDCLGALSQPVLDGINLMFDELVQYRHWTTDQAAEVRSGKMFTGESLTRLRFVQRFCSSDDAFSDFVLAVEKSLNVS